MDFSAEAQSSSSNEARVLSTFSARKTEFELVELPKVQAGSSGSSLEVGSLRPLLPRQSKENKLVLSECQFAHVTVQQRLMSRAASKPIARNLVIRHAQLKPAELDPAAQALLAPEVDDYAPEVKRHHQPANIHKTRNQLGNLNSDPATIKVVSEASPKKSKKRSAEADASTSKKKKPKRD